MSKDMPCYHSKYNAVTPPPQEYCGCALLGLKTTVRGPAPILAADEEDIIDETIRFFRANVFFRNFEVKGGADRTLIYLTLYVGQCLQECERIATKSEAEKVLHQTALKTFSIPGESGWKLGGMFPPPKSTAEGEGFKAYMKQCREEIGLRIVNLLYLPDGSKNKWWQCFAKRKFMSKTL